MMLRALAKLVVCIGILLVAGHAAAQSRDRAAGEALFRAGRQAADAGDWQKACQRFEESNRLDPAVGTVFNLGYCREQLGQLASAWQRYLEVIERLPASDERAGLAQERARALEKRVPRLVLELTGAPEGTVVLRDGVELTSASFDVALPVDPGAHVVEVRAPGHEPRRFEVSVVEGESKNLALAPGEVSPAKPTDATAAATQAPPPATEAAGKSSTKTIGFIVGGVGLLAIAASLTAGALAISAQNTIEEECDNKRCTDEGLQAGDRGRTLTTIANIAAAVGVAGLGVGAYLVLTSNSSTPETTASTPARVNGAVLGVRGTF
jgi:hypothetical protein